MHVSTRPLGALASKRTGKRVDVIIDAALRETRMAGYTVRTGPGCYRIGINPYLFQWQEVRGVGRVFWHELGHILAGDVDRGQPTVAGTPTPAQLAEGTRYSATAPGKASESRADAYADKMLATYGESYIWNLCITGE